MDDNSVVTYWRDIRPFWGLNQRPRSFTLYRGGFALLSGKSTNSRLRNLSRPPDTSRRQASRDDLKRSTLRPGANPTARTWPERSHPDKIDGPKRLERKFGYQSIATKFEPGSRSIPFLAAPANRGPNIKPENMRMPSSYEGPVCAKPPASTNFSANDTQSTVPAVSAKRPGALAVGDDSASVSNKNRGTGWGSSPSYNRPARPNPVRYHETLSGRQYIVEAGATKLADRKSSVSAQPGSDEVAVSRPWSLKHPLALRVQSAQRMGNSFGLSDFGSGERTAPPREANIGAQQGPLQGEIWLDTLQLTAWLSDYLNEHFGKVLRSVHGPERALDPSRIPV